MSQILKRPTGIFQVKKKEGRDWHSRHRESWLKARSSEKMAYLGKQEEFGMWKEWLGTVQGKENPGPVFQQWGNTLKPMC